MHEPRRARAESSRLRARPARGFVRPAPAAARIGRWICAWLVVLFGAASHAQTPPGTVITNTALGLYTPPSGTPTTVMSNPDAITTGVARTPSSTLLLHYAPGAAGSFSTNVGPAA